MKKTIKLAVVAALALGTTSAFATNGSTLIGVGAKSRGMAGVGIGMGHGAESALVNPALITTIEKDHEVSFGGTVFMPNVSTEITNSAAGSLGKETSAANMNVIPAVSIANKVNDNFYWGIGIWGTAGMGVDYRDSALTTGNMQMVTNLQLMQFGLPLAYTTNGFSIGLTPVLQYGALDINYNNSGTSVGTGVAQDLEFGFNVGLAYEIEGITIGATYKSQIDMKYKGVLSTVTQPFATMGVFPAPMEDKLSTPAEMGIGASYNMGEHTVAIDYKNIKWSDAKGYKEFGWDDQNVVTVGYEYATKTWAARLGYNYASNPISDAGAQPISAYAGDPAIFGGNALNMFNLLGFPATVESHIAVGGTYAFDEVMSVDLAYVYGLQSTTTLATMPDLGTGTDNETEVKHSQNSVSVQLNYAF
ncbi:MAG: outer membrane protein transport protein [Campylobacterales bacterium]|nr:outer membrane protein transport protein [Campylobacterales bacterium]